MPENTRVARCVKRLKKKGGVKSPYAVCQASTGQSYQTGKTKTKEGKKIASSKSKGKSWYKKQYNKSRG